MQSTSAVSRLFALSVVVCLALLVNPIAASSAVPTITSLSPSTTTAGGAAFTMTVAGTGFVSGTNATTVKWGATSLATTYVSATSVKAAVPATLITTVGAYKVTVTTSGGTSAAKSFTVTQATPAITWATPAAITYGTALSATQLNATSKVAGTWAYTPKTGSVLAAGSQTLSVTFTPTDTVDYTKATATVTLTVGKAALTVTANNASRLYGAANPTFTAAYSGFVNGDTSAVLSGSPALSTTATSASAIGSFTITAAAGTLAAANYTFTFKNGTLSVTQAPLRVTAANVSRPYGTANPTLTAIYSGFVNGDTATTALTGSPTLSSTATVTSTVGAYPITVVAGTLKATNYSFTFVNGTLTVTRATPPITWPTPAAITYGTALSATQLNATSTVRGGFVYKPISGTVLAAGVQPLSVTLTPTDTTDYTTATATVSLTVNKATPTVTWTAPAAITYGTALSGTQLNATLSVAGNCIYTPAAGTVLAAGTQTLSATCTPTDTTDYSTPAAKTVSLTVNKAVLTVTAQNVSRAYNTANPTFTAAYSGFVNSDTSAVLSGAPSLSTSATTSSAAGSYPITAAVGTLKANNYSFSFVNGTLTVTQAAPLITWSNPAAIPYGTALSGTQLNASLSVAGNCIYTPAAGTVLAAGTQTLSVACTPTDTTDYSTPAAKTVSLT